jgi:hypothetical protein
LPWLSQLSAPERAKFKAACANATAYIMQDLTNRQRRAAFIAVPNDDNATGARARAGCAACRPPSTRTTGWLTARASACATCS